MGDEFAKTNSVVCIHSPFVPQGFLTTIVRSNNFLLRSVSSSIFFFFRKNNNNDLLFKFCLSRGKSFQSRTETETQRDFVTN